MRLKSLLFCILLCILLPIPFAYSQKQSSNIQQELRVSPNPYVVRDSSQFKQKEKFPGIDSLHVPGIVYGRRVMSEMQQHGWYKAVSVSGSTVRVLERRLRDTDWMFYLLCGLLFVLAFLRIAFNKYFKDMFRVFFNTSIRQRQIRDQLQQAPLPSLLFNIFFVLSGGTFIFFLLQFYHTKIEFNRWIVMGLCIVGLSVLYAGKLLVLKLLGWMFGWEKAVETYLFIVFLVNKIVGIFLLPVTVLLAFSPLGAQKIIVTISFVGLLILFVYRFIRAYASIRNELKISQLYFFLYVCAFEVVPVLLIYRLLMQII